MGRSALVLGAGVLLLGLAVLAARGIGPFWPRPVAEWVIETDAGDSRRLFAQQVRASGTHSADTGRREYLLRMPGAAGAEYRWVAADRVLRRSEPENLVTLTTTGGGRLHGYVRGLETAAAGVGGDQGLLPFPATAAVVLTLAERSERRIPLVDIVGVEYPNHRSMLHRVSLFGSAVADFVTGGENGAGAAGALYGTAVLALLMTVMLVPPGLLCALYLYSYGRGAAAATVRLAVTSLAGMPSVVVGVFVLGCFAYGVGGRLDAWLSGAATPVVGTGGLFWAALALAILSLPVMIVTAESGMRRVPADEVRGALALGASRARVMRDVVLPRARPAILGGVLMAVARSAGAVAPLLVVGGVADLAVAAGPGGWGGLFGDEPFGHLGRRVYVLATQDADPYTAAVRAYATALFLLLVVLLLNLVAMYQRGLPEHTE